MAASSRLGCVGRPGRLRLATTEAPQGEAVRNQTNCRHGHQGHDEVAVRRGPRHRTGREKGSDETDGDSCATHPASRAIALTCCVHDFALQRQAMGRSDSDLNVLDRHVVLAAGSTG